MNSRFIFICETSINIKVEPLIWLSKIFQAKRLPYSRFNLKSKEGIRNNLRTFTNLTIYTQTMKLSWWFSSKEAACNAEEAGLIPGLGRSPREGNGNPLPREILWTEEPGKLQFTGLQKHAHARVHTHTHTHHENKAENRNISDELLFSTCM